MDAKFSERTAWNFGENQFASEVRRLREAGLAPLDLTVANPTECGFTQDPATLLAPLAQQAALHYAPEPFGMPSGREAVVAYYRDHGAVVSPGHVCLTTSTSEGYSFLFRLLCDPGDDVMVARPSYPLFDYIAQLDGVVLREYPLHYDPNAGPHTPHGWIIDLHAVKASIGPRTRAILLVHPNNPTGQYTSVAERQALEALCVEHGLALIVDEVFLDYNVGSEAPAAATATLAGGHPACLTFVLSGLSKVCALPQMKASWIAASGPQQVLTPALERLEIIADTFLSMNAPVQHALPSWLAERMPMQEAIRARLRENLACLDRRLANTATQRLAFGGGWTAVLRVPRVDHGEFALAALGRGVQVQPGSFYGLPESRVVLSLLTPTETLQAGLDRLPLG